MRTISEFFHHRSLTVSIVALFFGLWASACIPHYATDATKWLLDAAFVAGLGLTFCTLNLILLLRDNRTGYESFRLSLATLLWAIACFPIVLLAIGVVQGILKLIA
jgi:hypothetical protein